VLPGEQWLARNQAAIDAWVEANGLFSDDWRTF
jgi:hypothetical protein